jgi:hypothetical protein
MTDQSYFLLQISQSGFKDLINDGIYKNLNWRNNNRNRDQGSMKENDIVVIYFTGKILFYKRQIKYIYQISKIENDNSIIHLDFLFQINPLRYNDIINLINSGDLSTLFKNCGFQGFNICKIYGSDYQTILKYKSIITYNYDEFKNKIKKMINEIDNNDMFELQSDLNLISLYKNNLCDLPAKKLHHFKKIGYIIIIDDKLILSDSIKNKINK